MTSPSGAASTEPAGAPGPGPGAEPAAGPVAGPAHVIVLGNEKGGSGKSTTAVHIAIALAQRGLRVAGLDLDGRQRSFTRYMENRRAYAEKNGLSLPIPHFQVILDSADAEADRARVEETVQALLPAHDAIVIDCPGRDSALSRAAHSFADTLITPLNDSFIDFDLLGTVDPDSYKVIRPSFYSELVWNCRKVRAARGGSPIDWVVMRTRLSHLEARNMRRVHRALEELAKRIGFRVVPGFSERVIYRELFLKGLTLLDLKSAGGSLSMSHLAARQELRELLDALNLRSLQAAAPAAAAARG